MDNINPNYSDLLNALSLILAMQNLSENREQSQYNDVHKANDKQAELLLKEINDRFAEQNDMLREHTALLTEILDILKKASDKNGNQKEYGGNHSHDKEHIPVLCQRHKCRGLGKDLAIIVTRI